jgi:hypothetical protein
MRILTLENKPYDLTEIPDENEDLSFWVLDNSDTKNPDYFAIPLIFLESFNSPALVLRIGPHEIKMPVDWSILIGEPDFGDLEVVPLTSINDRGFSSYTFNPRTAFKPEFKVVDIVDIYQDVRWYFPKLRPGQILAVPLHTGEDPMCAFFVKDITKACEIVNYSLVW